MTVEEGEVCPYALVSFPILHQTLAKVIAAVLKFSNEQTDQIIRKQEALQAHLKFNKPS